MSKTAKIVKTKRDRPIADKLVEKMNRYIRGKVVDFGAVMAGKQNAGDLQATVATRGELADLHPAHAFYVYAQNQTSVMSEQLTALDVMNRFVKLISRAEEIYMPGGPATRRDGGATSDVHLRLKPGGHDWQAYFRGTLPDVPLADRIAAYEHHMKFGPSRDYWTEFVFEAYVNHRADVIFLAGLPDVSESRPRSRVNS